MQKVSGNTMLGMSLIVGIATAAALLADIRAARGGVPAGVVDAAGAVGAGQPAPSILAGVRPGLGAEAQGVHAGPGTALTREARSIRIRDDRPRRPQRVRANSGRPGASGTVRVRDDRPQRPRRVRARRGWRH